MKGQHAVDNAQGKLRITFSMDKRLRNSERNTRGLHLFPRDATPCMGLNMGCVLYASKRTSARLELL
jgi:hypothetical protein